MKKITIICLITAIVFAACKKDKDKDENAVTLKGKWNVENSVTKEFVNNALVTTYTDPGNGTTMDFQDNGHVVITYPGSSVESFTYAIKSNSQVEIDGDLFEIRSLTQASVALFLRQDYSPGEYDEVLISLRR